MRLSNANREERASAKGGVRSCRRLVKVTHAVAQGAQARTTTYPGIVAPQNFSLGTAKSGFGVSFDRPTPTQLDSSLGRKRILPNMARTIHVLRNKPNFCPCRREE